MSLLVIDFTYLEGKDGELVVKWLAALKSHSNKISSYVFKIPYSWEELSLFNVRMNEAIVHGCNWNYVYVPYSDLEAVLHREVSSAVAIYCFGPVKTEFISSLTNRTVIYITQQGCPSIADTNLSAISCTFACHKSKHVCALRSAYSVAQWLHFYTISLKYVSCPSQPAYHWCFPDVGLDVTAAYLPHQRKGDKEGFPLLG